MIPNRLDETNLMAMSRASLSEKIKITPAPDPKQILQTLVECAIKNGMQMVQCSRPKFCLPRFQSSCQAIFLGSCWCIAVIAAEGVKRGVRPPPGGVGGANPPPLWHIQKQPLAYSKTEFRTASKCSRPTFCLSPSQVLVNPRGRARELAASRLSGHLTDCLPKHEAKTCSFTPEVLQN